MKTSVIKLADIATGAKLDTDRHCVPVCTFAIIKISSVSLVGQVFSTRVPTTIQVILIT